MRHFAIEFGSAVGAPFIKRIIMPRLVHCLLVVVCAAPLSAQNTNRCDQPTGSTITGNLRDMHSKAPLSNVFVSLYRDPDLYCRTHSDVDGQFSFRGVPAGTFILIAGKRFDIKTTGADTVRIAVDLVTGGPIEVCEKTPSCAAWVRPMLVRGLSDIEQFEFTLLRLAAVLGVGNPTESTRWYCIPHSSKLILETMRRLYFRSVPSSQCDVIGDEDPRDTGLYLVDTATGQRAVLLNTGQNYAGHDPSSEHWKMPGRALGRDEREAKIGYYVGPLYAEGWTCLLRKTKDGWIPTSCRQDWVS